jgi:predicted TIM-barrel fold metal-dependent hydrolase
VIIDFHTHVVSQKIKNNRASYVERDACFALLYAQPEAKLVTAEEIIAHMDECCVDKSVILNIGWQSHELCVETNDYILESAAKYSQRLIAFCAVQPLANEKAVVEIERCARCGAMGFGELRPDIQEFGLINNKRLGYVIEAIIANNLVLLIHASEPVGHKYIGKGEVTPDIIYKFIESFPDLKLVCAHWGGGLPFYALMPEVKKAFTNVYFDTAATPFLYTSDIFYYATKILGNGKVLFGSDYPLLSPTRVLAQIKTVDLCDEDKAKILGKNAASLLLLHNDY